MNNRARYYQSYPQVMGLRKMKSPAILTFFGLLVCPSGAAIANEQTVVRVDLEPMVGSALMGLPPDDPLRDVTVSIEVDNLQPNVAEGLVFVVDIFNRSNVTIELDDPTERVAPILINPHGRLCQLNDVASMSTINSANPEATRASLDARRAYVIDRPESGTSPPGAKTAHDIGRSSRNWRVQLEPGERLWLPLRIKEVQADPEQHRANLRQYGRDSKEAQDQGLAQPSIPLPQRGAILAGTHKLRVSVGLIRFDRDSASATGWRLESKTITVRLGVCPSIIP